MTAASTEPRLDKALGEASASFSYTREEALDALTLPVARLWCRSFGVVCPQAQQRLNTALKNHLAASHLAGSSAFATQHVLDQATETLIRRWFEYVLGHELATGSRSMALTRLAFLDCNHDGRWSSHFLSEAVPVQELAGALQNVMIEPTPVPMPCAMARQPL